MTSPANARNRAQSYFTSSEQRADTLRAEVVKERASVDAKTARLKALRIAKEADDKIEADRLAAEKIAKENAAPRKISRKKPTVTGADPSAIG